MRQLRISQQITPTNEFTLEKYLREISRFKLITPDKEILLSQRIQNGDADALETLINSNLRFVVSVSKQYQNQGLQLSDLINEGNIGLLKAAQRFDHTKGFKFISYAVWWIRQSILQALAENGKLIRIPCNKINMLSKIKKTFSNMEQEFQREPTIEEIAEITKTNAKTVEELMGMSKTQTPIDSPLGGDDNLTWLDQYDEGSMSLEENHNYSLKAELTKLLSILKPRNAEILSCYYGLNGEYPQNLEEIAARFNLTKERIRQVKEESLSKLRKKHAKENFLSFL